MMITEAASASLRDLWRRHDIQLVPNHSCELKPPISVSTVPVPAANGITPSMVMNFVDAGTVSQVSAETPGGQTLRRYWHPIAYAAELPEGVFSKRVQLLGEELVLYRSPQGELHLMDARCPHRGAALEYGFVENTGIRCAYHGWLFSHTGQCLEQPFEKNPQQKDRVKAKSYLVKNLKGLIFAYLGESSHAPALPIWDLFSRNDGYVYFEKQADIQANWFQVQENAADVTHTYYLHSQSFKKLGMVDNTGFNRLFKMYGFLIFEYGLLKTWKYVGDENISWGNPLVFPNILRLQTEIHWRVPLTDRKTRIFWATFLPFSEVTRSSPAPGSVIQQKNRMDQHGNYTMADFPSQDAMAVETQGEIADRSKEILGSTDIGLSMFRKLFIDQTKLDARSPSIMGVSYGTDCVDIDLSMYFGGRSATSTRVDNKLFEKNQSKWSSIKNTTYREILL